VCRNIFKLNFVVNIFAKKLKKLKTQELEDTNSGKKSYHLEYFIKIFATS